MSKDSSFTVRDLPRQERPREITGLQFSPATVLALILAVIGTLYMGIFPANVLSFAQKSIVGLM